MFSQQKLSTTSLQSTNISMLVMDCWLLYRNLANQKRVTKSLCPLILLIMLRKVSSSIVLTRIQPSVEEYLSHSQSAYCHGRSTSDIIWCHRFLAARVQKLHEGIMITGIDMNSAFDTIKRTKLIEILKSFLREDEIGISEYSSVTQH